MNYAGLIYDDSLHYLDHLAPFCALTQCPLILCDSALASLARRYYPDLKVIETPIWDLKLPPYVVTCDNRPLLQAAFPGQSFQTLWLPHGHSDKGINAHFLKEETLLFAYGQKSVDSLSLPCIRIGNFRWAYYLQHRAFYEKILPHPGKTLLYAPTWDDFENNNSFWDAFPFLAKHPSLLVKLHPNTTKKFAPQLEILQGQHPNVLFLPNIPPIYPLLVHCDAYIGDLSSIGYDFLHFDRPLFFFKHNPHLPLHRCGAPFVLPIPADSFSPLRKSLYAYTFDPTPDWTHVKEQIDALCCV